MHEKFHYKTLDDITDKLTELRCTLPLSENSRTLCSPLSLQNHTIHNRIAIQPMEGCDGTPDGKPDELTVRRYRRFAKSGAGLIWLEATAIVPEGRANPRQLMISPENLDSFKRLTDMIKTESIKANGFEPFIVCQLTHSGRYSKLNGVPEPLIAYNNPLFEKDGPIDQNRIVTDGYLQFLEEKYGLAASLCEQAGFDGADIKACHRYLISELLSAYNREGFYGGSFENRTRLLRNAVKNAQEHISKDFVITCRLNSYDGFPYPYGFGVNQGNGLAPDLTEPVRLVRFLHDKLNMPLIDLTIGNPYVNPHVNRPYDNGGYTPDEHPLIGVARMFSCIKAVKEACPGIRIISSGHSYLRQFSANLAAGAVEQGISDMAGFGRQAFAYPDFARELLRSQRLDPQKCCITCGKCTELMRAGSVAGCVVRDSEVYLPIYKEKIMEAKK